MVRREVSTHLAALRAAEMAPNAPGAASAEGDSSSKEAEAGYVAKKIQQLIDNIKVGPDKPPPLAGRDSTPLILNTACLPLARARCLSRMCMFDMKTQPRGQTSHSRLA